MQNPRSPAVRAAAVAVTVLTALPLHALAHEGHGMPGTAHWHATDAWGWAVTAALAGLAIWLSRRK